MGKRKWRADRNNTPPPAVSMPHASHMESSLKEKPSHSIGPTGVNSMSSSLMNIMERSPNAHHRHHNLNRALLLRLPRHYFSIQNSQRNSANHAGASTSNGKSTPEDKLSLKLGHRSESASGYHAERKEKASRRPERIRSSTLAVDSLSPDVTKMLCGLCQRMLKRKPCILESAITSTDLSVVAVLVCGHVYHADCLERRTPNEYRRDPPCPLCTSPAIGN